jgi:phosphoglycolate phosphatase-like HAD superfamily hydrolase
MRLDAYATLVFDCDGVVLDSNRIKTEAFRSAAMPWGAAAADALVAHHITNGGVSRYAKFEHFLDVIVTEHALCRDGPGLEALLNAYAQAVLAGLMSCAIAEGLEALRVATSHTRWLIVSGGDQSELRTVFAARGLDMLFDGGIFGSPDTKDEILARELASGALCRPALFLGDSRYDHIAAEQAKLDFVFIHAWTEMPGWKEYMLEHNIMTVPRICDLEI